MARLNEVNDLSKDQDKLALALDTINVIPIQRGSGQTVTIGTVHYVWSSEPTLLACLLQRIFLRTKRCSSRLPPNPRTP